MICKFIELNQSSPHDLLKFRIKSLVINEIIKSDAAYIVIVVPIVVQFLDMLLFSLILRLLCIVQVQNIDLSDHECLDRSLVALLGNHISFLSDLQLGSLVIKVFHQQENILIETDFLLANLGQCHIAVRLGNLHFAPALTPVENRDRHADFHHLVSL